MPLSRLRASRRAPAALYAIEPPPQPDARATRRMPICAQPLIMISSSSGAAAATPPRSPPHHAAAILFYHAAAEPAARAMLFVLCHMSEAALICAPMSSLIEVMMRQRAAACCLLLLRPHEQRHTRSQRRVHALIATTPRMLARRSPATHTRRCSDAFCHSSRHRRARRAMPSGAPPPPRVADAVADAVVNIANALLFVARYDISRAENMLLPSVFNVPAHAPTFHLNDNASRRACRADVRDTGALRRYARALPAIRQKEVPFPEQVVAIMLPSLRQRSDNIVSPERCRRPRLRCCVAAKLLPARRRYAQRCYKEQRNTARCAASHVEARC